MRLAAKILWLLGVAFVAGLAWGFSQGDDAVPAKAHTRSTVDVVQEDI